MIDEHYYAPPKWFLDNATRYDHYDRNGPIVFAGEYAAHGPDNQDPTSRNTWLSALTEAAFMTGLERNADIVHLASYAPLLAHVEAWQWRPDLIWFDNLHVMGTPNYYVQKLYSTNRGTHVVPITSENKALTGQDSIYASAVIDQNTDEIIIKVVNTATESAEIMINLEGANISGNIANIMTLTAPDLMVYNTIDQPKNIYPVEQQLNVSTKNMKFTLGAATFSVIKAQLIR